MWHKFVNYFVSAFGLPILTAIFNAIKQWWDNKKALDKILDEIEKDVREIELSQTEQEQKDALKRLVEGVRRRRSNL